jgi:hypothetical protein
VVPEVGAGGAGERKEHNRKPVGRIERSNPAGKRVPLLLLRKLYSDYITFKTSIYNLLCYVFLCKYEWQQTIYYATLYQSFSKQYQTTTKETTSQQKIYYSILTYKLEAYCQLNRMDRAYELLHDMVSSIDYTDTNLMECCTSSTQRTSGLR